MQQGEDKHKAFCRLATKRTNAVLDKLRVLGHCANRALYEYDADDVRMIFNAIEEELRDVKARFRSPKESKFTLEP